MGLDVDDDRMGRDLGGVTHGKSIETLRAAALFTTSARETFNGRHTVGWNDTAGPGLMPIAAPSFRLTKRPSEESIMFRPYASSTVEAKSRRA